MVVQLNFTEIESFYMVFERSLSIFSMTSLKQLIEYFISGEKSSWTSLYKYLDEPDVLVPLDVDLVELARDRRDEVLLHLDRHVLRQHGEQEALLKSESAVMTAGLLTFWH